MVWYSHLLKNFPQLVVIHRVKALGLVNKAEVIFSQELSCFYDNPKDVGNFILGSSVFQLEHLEDHSSHTVEAWLGEF